jgi:hypothetical protein
VSFSFSSEGDWSKTERFLRNMMKFKVDAAIQSAGAQGVSALAKATPRDSGLAANSWTFEVKKSSGGFEIDWTNTDDESGFKVALMIQYGHGTGTGGYVHGIDYINPAMRPVFDQIAETVWKAVTSA